LRWVANGNSFSCVVFFSAYPAEELLLREKEGAAPPTPSFSYMYLFFTPPRPRNYYQTVFLRTVRDVRDTAQSSRPSNTRSGRSLAVFGSFEGAGSLDAVSTGAGVGAE